MRLHFVLLLVGILTFGWVLCAQAKRANNAKDGRNVSSGTRQKSNTQNNRGIVSQIGWHKNDTSYNAAQTRNKTNTNQIGWRYNNTSNNASRNKTNTNQIGWRYNNTSNNASRNKTNTNQIGWRYNNTSNSAPSRQNSTHVYPKEPMRNNTQINQNHVNNTRVTRPTTPVYVQPTRMPAATPTPTRRNNTNVHVGLTNSTTQNRGTVYPPNHGSTSINHNIPPVYPPNHASTSVNLNIPTMYIPSPNIPNQNAPPVIIVVNNSPPPKSKLTTTTPSPLTIDIPKRKATIARQRPTKAPTPPPPPYPSTPLAPFRSEMLYLPGGPLGYYTCNAPDRQAQQFPNSGYTNGAWTAPQQSNQIYNPQFAGNVQSNTQPGFGYSTTYAQGNGQQSYQNAQGQAGQPSSYTNPMYLGNNQLPITPNSAGINQPSTYVNPMYLGNNQLSNAPNSAGINQPSTYVNPMYLGNNQLPNTSNSAGMNQSSTYVNPMYLGNNQLPNTPNQPGQLAYNGSYIPNTAGFNYSTGYNGTNFQAPSNVNGLLSTPGVPQPYITGPQGQLCAFAFYPPEMNGHAPGSLKQPLAGNVAFSQPGVIPSGTNYSAPGPYQSYPTWPQSAYPNNQPGVVNG